MKNYRLRIQPSLLTLCDVSPKTSLAVRSKERRLYSQARIKFLTKIQVKLVIYIPGNVRNVVFLDVSEFRGIFLVVRVRESFNLPKKYLVFNVN